MKSERSRQMTKTQTIIRLLALLGVTMLLVGVGLIVYNKVQAHVLRKDYSVFGDDIYSPYSVTAEDDEYCIVEYRGFLDQINYAVPKANLKDYKSSLIGKGVLLFCEKGTGLGNPVEARAVIVDGNEGRLVYNIQKIIKDYGEDGIAFIMLCIIIFVIDGVVLIVSKIFKKMKTAIER